ncbi:putative membrane protein YeaQ/YmgE (transglycosylase-associated protein family) [Polaromonas sp. CG_9.5]|uniref:GlsB/YeaQ/YmgE family stress response membrane protein n=1 Tax=Polaromonas sp. CG_9.5 TaxID=3071705 RepID=UPI002E076412|nr:putative membrane protein YeaQ/YmgE (transglycosylase-associated protein family) [Polaromonas sp. CG_9.5]
MSIIWTILIGFIVGIVAKFMMPGRDPAGFFITAIIGIVGSIIATYLGRFMGFYQVGESAGFIAAIVGAIILLFLYRMVTGRKG